MRKLVITTAIVLLASPAFAGGMRGLSGPEVGAEQPIAVPQERPIRRAEVTILRAPSEQPSSVEDKLKAAGELKSDGTPAHPPEPQTPIQPQPVRAVSAQQAAPVQEAAQATPVARSKHVRHARKQPARQRVAHRGESKMNKARRIAAHFGIYW